MPMYDEFSVKELWTDMKDSEDFMKYFPAQFPKGRLPDRAYFFNIMNTLMEDYVQQIIKHANVQRSSPASQAMAASTIEVTDEWYEKLSAIPFVSCKCTSRVNIFKNARATRYTS